MTPYPWGFSRFEIDSDLAQQSKFALRQAAGVMQDGTPFDMPGESPLPEAIDIPETAAGQIVLADDAGRRTQHARGRRQPHARAPVVTFAARKRISIPLRHFGSRKRSRSPIRG